MNDQKGIRPEPEDSVRKQAKPKSAPSGAQRKKEEQKLDFSEININLGSKSFIKSAILVLISLLLLIFAFCPIITYTAKDYKTYYDEGKLEYETYRISIGHSAAKGIGLFFDSVSSKSDTELRELALYEKYEKVVEDYIRQTNDLDDGKVTGKYKRLEKQYINTVLRLTLKTKGVTPSLDGFFLPLFAFALIILSILLFLLSLLNLFYEVMGIEAITDHKLLSRRYIYRISTMLLAAIPGIIILLFTLMFMGFGVNDVYPLTGKLFDARISFTAVLSVILSLGAMITLAVFRVIDKKMVFNWALITRIGSAALALIFILFAFAPIASVKVGGDYTLTEKTVRTSVNMNTLQGLRLDKHSSLRVVPNEAYGSIFDDIDLNIGLMDEGKGDQRQIVLTCCMLPWFTMIIFAVVIFIANVWQLGFGFIRGKNQLGIRIANMVLSLFVTGIFGYWTIVFAFINEAHIDGRLSLVFLLYPLFAALYFVFIPFDRKKRVKKESAAQKEADAPKPAPEADPANQ